jgi:uncharacterized protein with FMN-binding domain
VRRITFWFMSTCSAVVLLFSYHTSTNSIASADVAPVPQTEPDAATTTTPKTPDSSRATAAATYTGSRVNTRWGIVQVQITVQNGKITNSRAVEYPYRNRRDQQINNYALPILNQDVIRAQSAHIDAISGATVTSDGYVHSLQSAIDQAHL